MLEAKIELDDEKESYAVRDFLSSASDPGEWNYPSDPASQLEQATRYLSGQPAHRMFTSELGNVSIRLPEAFNPLPVAASDPTEQGPRQVFFDRGIDSDEYILPGSTWEIPAWSMAGATLSQETTLHHVVNEFAQGVEGDVPTENAVRMADRIVCTALFYTTGTHITFDDDEGYLDFHLRLGNGLLVMANVFPDGGVDASVYDDSQGSPVQVVRRMRRGTTTGGELVDLFRAGVHASPI